MGASRAKCPGFRRRSPQGLTSEPGDHPHDIHRGGIQQLLEVRDCQPNVPTLTEINAPDALREATLHPCPQGVLGVGLGGFLSLAGSLDGLMVGLRPDGELSWSAFRRGARTTGGTRATGGSVKPNANDRIARDIVTRPPVDTGMPLGTVGLLRLPIQDKGLQVIALTGLMLPALRPKGGTDHINLMLALRRDETVGIHVATIEPVGPRQQFPGG
jgi:hypothetical protein